MSVAMSHAANHTMSPFYVIVRTASGVVSYEVVGESSASVGECVAAWQNEPCGVTVRPV